MRKLAFILSFVMCFSCLCGCRKAVMNEYYDDNSLETVYKNHSSFTITTKLADGNTYTRYYEPDMSYIEKDGTASIYLSSGSYSYNQAEDYYFVEVFNLQDYSYFILNDRFTAPLVAQAAKVSSVLSEEETGSETVVKTRPTDAYIEDLCAEYGVEGGEFEITYSFDSDGALLKSKEIYLNGDLFAELSVEYNTKRPKIADELLKRLNADANNCRTVKISMGAGSSNVRSVIVNTVKGDKFKLEDSTFDLYEGPYADVKCTVPYESKGADHDAIMYWKQK